METKMITIPFDLERAKRIQAGEEPGKIVTRNGLDVRVVCWDLQKENFPIIAAISQDGDEDIYYRTAEGRVRSYGRIESDCDLILQIPEYTQYKDGDILGADTCVFILNEHGQYKTSCYVGIFYEDLAFGGAADKNNISYYSYATEQQKQQLIDALKSSPDLLAKEYLKRFFGIKKEEFQPFDKILVRDSDDEVWKCHLFSHISDIVPGYPYRTVFGYYKYCIPYNDQTKHLLGTTDPYDFCE